MNEFVLKQPTHWTNLVQSQVEGSWEVEKGRVCLSKRLKATLAMWSANSAGGKFGMQPSSSITLCCAKESHACCAANQPLWALPTVQSLPLPQLATGLPRLHVPKLLLSKKRLATPAFSLQKLSAPAGQSQEKGLLCLISCCKREICCMAMRKQGC